MLETFRSELYSVVGEERNRPALHEHQVVEEGIANFDRGDFSKQKRPHQLQVPVYDDKQKPIFARSLDYFPQNMNGHELEWS